MRSGTQVTRCRTLAVKTLSTVLLVGYFATTAAVYLGGLAGDIAAEKFGKRAMLASDVRECLGEAFERIKN